MKTDEKTLDNFRPQAAIQGRKLREQLARVSSRYRLECLLGSLEPFLLTGGGFTLLGWLLRLVGEYGNVPVWIAGLGWLAGFLLFVVPHLPRPGLFKAARVLDQRADEQDRFLSALSFAEKGSRGGMESLTLSNAENRLGQLPWRDLFRLRPKRRFYPILLLSFVFLSLLMWSPASRGLRATPRLGSRAAQELVAEHLGEDSSLEALLKELEAADSSEQVLKLLDEMRRRVGPAGLDEAVLVTDLKDLAAAGDPTNRFAASLNADDLVDLAEALREAGGDLENSASELSQFLEDLPPAETMQNRMTRELMKDLEAARKSLEQQRPGQAAEELNQAAEQLEKLAQERESRAEKQAAAQAIESMQQQMQQEADSRAQSGEQNAGAGSMGAEGSVAAPSDASAEESSTGQVAGGTGDSSSPGPEDALKSKQERNPLDARFEVELGQTRRLVREPSGRKTRDLPSMQVRAVRPPQDGRLQVNQELEQALTAEEIPLRLRERIRQYLIAINDGNRNNSGN